MGFMNKLAPVFVILAGVLWGVDGILLRPFLYTLPVTLVVFIESAVVALILTPFFIRQLGVIRKLEMKDWLVFFGVALFGGAIGTMAITKALFYVNFVNLSIVVLIQKLQPLFALGLAAALLKERLPSVFFVWAALAVLGAYLMTFGMNLPQWQSEPETVLAALFALTAAGSFGFSTVLSKRALKNVSFEIGTYLRFLVSSVILVLIVAGSGSYSAVTQISQKQVIVFLIIVFSTGGPAIFLYYFGLKRIRASVATIAELAFPLTAVLLEYFLRDNLLGPVQWLGVAILFLAILKVSSYEMDIPEKLS